MSILVLLLLSYRLIFPEAKTNNYKIASPRPSSQVVCDEYEGHPMLMGKGAKNPDGTATVTCAYVCPDDLPFEDNACYHYNIGSWQRTIILPPHLNPPPQSTWLLDQASEQLFCLDPNMQCNGEAALNKNCTNYANYDFFDKMAIDGAQ